MQLTFKKIFFTPTKIIRLMTTIGTAIVVTLVSNANAAPGDELPTINPKFVHIIEKNPTRDAGFVVGDILERTITLTVKKPYELVKESLPIVGYEHRYKGQISGIELVNINTSESNHADSVTHTLHLSYQIFTTGKLAKPAALRAEIVKIRNTEKKELLQYRIPSFSFRISPLSVFGAVKLQEEMSPFTLPLRIDSAQDKLYLKLGVAVLALALLGLFYILGSYAWLPRMRAPFAKAHRDIKKMPESLEGIQSAVTRIHQSLNQTAGMSLFNDNLSEFIAKKPAFAPAENEIKHFFQLSRFTFFEADTAQKLETASKNWLLSFCRHLRDCERGLTPHIDSKTGAEHGL